MKYYIQTFGCKVSQYESQAMREAWQKNFPNYNETSSPEEADLLIIASCAVTQEGVTDARQLCNKWCRNFPNAHIIVTGCAAEIAQEDFKLANAVVTQKARDLLLTSDPLLLQGYFHNDKPSYYPDFTIEDFKRSRPVIKIQDGCSHYCSYCIVPYSRGGSRSRSIDDILQEVEILLEKGFREFVLSGINLRQYNFQDKDFWDVLIALQNKFAKDYENIARFRLSSLEPAQLNDKGIEALTLSKMLSPHLHLSLQSGSQEVLKRMKREHYLISDVHKYLDKLSKYWNTFALGADFLLGFPQESQEEFEESYSLVQELPFTYAHIFPYSIRPNTVAAKYKGQILKEVKKERTALLRALIAEKKEAFLQNNYEIHNSSHLKISLDIPKEEIQLPENTTIIIDGIDQYYTACKVEVSKNEELERIFKHGHDLLNIDITNIGKDSITAKLATNL